MQFMILIYGCDEAWDALGPDDHQKLADAHARVHNELRANNELRFATELETDDAWIIRASDGTATATEGPFTEGREVLSGYYLIDCAGTERAVEIAKMFHEAVFAPIEVRRLGAGSTWVDALATPPG
jgi:hypothetical protein